MLNILLNKFLIKIKIYIILYNLFAFLKLKLCLFYFIVLFTIFILAKKLSNFLKIIQITRLYTIGIRMHEFVWIYFLISTLVLRQLISTSLSLGGSVPGLH